MEHEPSFVPAEVVEENMQQRSEEEVAEAVGGELLRRHDTDPAERQKRELAEQERQELERVISIDEEDIVGVQGEEGAVAAGGIETPSVLNEESNFLNQSTKEKMAALKETMDEERQVDEYEIESEEEEQEVTGK